MKANFFIKYSNYKTGIRFDIDGQSFVVLHNEERMPEDEILDKGFESLQTLQARLKGIFGDVEGGRWFIHFVQDLISVSEKMYRKNPAERARRRAKKAP